MSKLRGLLIRHKAILLYLLFGGLTTVVNFVVYWPLYHSVGIPAAASNAIAWAVAVLFAFLTNKPFVFRSNDWSGKVLVPEFLKFVGCRVLSGAFETLFIGLTVDLLLWNGLIMKIIVSVVVIVLNYIASKWLVFKGKIAG